MSKDINFAEIRERLYFLYKITKGLKQAASGDTISHAEAKKKIQKWSE